MKKEMRLQKANQDITTHLLKWPKSKSLMTLNVFEDMEPQKLSFTVGENARRYSHLG